MRIKKSSWHYKLNMLGDHTQSKTLCTYFWCSIFKILGLTFIFSFASLILYSIGMTTYDYWTSLFFGMITVILLFILFSACLPSLVIHFLRKISKKPLETQCSNIAMEYIKAKKRKVCPIIEYVD